MQVKQAAAQLLVPMHRERFNSDDETPGDLCMIPLLDPT